MTISEIFGDILKTFAACVGIPACNAWARHRRQGDGKLQVVTRENVVIAISATQPNGGYIRWESDVKKAYKRGCSANEYSADFALILWQQGGDVIDLQDRALYWLANCDFNALPYSLIDTEASAVNTAYEEIMVEENDAPPPTQSGLAVVKVIFTLSFVATDCQITPPVCAAPIVVPPAPPIPAPVQLFFDNAGITDPALRAILLARYERITTRSYFPKMAAEYPFVGGNANAHKFNFLDARDVDAAFRLQLNGGWLHGANGMQGNAINTWANTFWNEAANASANSWNFGFYSRTQTGNIQWCDIGQFNGVRASNIFPRVTIINPDRLYLHNGSSGAEFTAGATTTVRLYQCNRVDTTNIRARVNGTLIIQPTPYLGQTNLNYSIGSLNNNGVQQFFSAREYGYAFIANQGFTDAEMIDFENDVTDFMTALGRNV